jgi:hypothetical protein
MATIALFEAARYYSDPAALELAERNLRYNINRYYVDEGDIATIVEGKSVKLGAVALAALAIRMSTQREGYAVHERKLVELTEAMWQGDGSFRTFLRPAGRDQDCQNFYPGETLLLWADRWVADREPCLWAKIDRSFSYYSDWHRKFPNPAFVPWHTKAYFKLWKATGDERLRDFIFEMNDWLLPFQQWDQVASHPDLQGRFYDPHKPYGPPHASSTGVYLEGLADAMHLARQVGDMRRVEKYELAIRRGIRNLLQLQFFSGLEFARYSESARLRLGIRTNEYCSVVRVDNVQHSLMALLGLSR